MPKPKTERSTELHHIGRHHPAYASNQRLRPNDMKLIKVDDDMGKAMHDIAASIFADCCNAGMPFQSALTAIYISGLNHGSCAQKDKQLTP